MGSNTRRILVTGAAGFIGFHTALRLQKNGHHVIGLDNFSPYYSIQLKKHRCNLLQQAGVPVLNVDIADASTFATVLKETPFTHLVHLAAQAGVRYSLEQPRSYIRSNIDGFLNVLEIVRQRPEIQVVYASSSSVYGSNTKLPFSEEDSTDGPTNLYGATKKANEVMAASYHHLFGLKLIGLRFFTVYGPLGRPDMAYSIFANKILRDEEIPLFGDGTDSRDFTYIDDIVDGIEKALLSNIQYGIYNLGNNHPERVIDLISALSTALGKKARIAYMQRQEGDMSHTFADVRKAFRDFGFAPKVPFADGIKQFAQWHSSYYER